MNIIVLHRLSFVRGVEIKSRVVVLDGLEVLPERLLDAGVSGQLVGPRNQFYISGTHQQGSALAGPAFSPPLIVVSYCRG